MCKDTISVYQFLKDFPNETAAREYLEERRWKDGIKCPHCDNYNITRQKQAQYFRCRCCRKVFTVRTGTIFERSHIPLDKWLYAMYLVETARKGVSSLQISKELGIRQASAWFMLHRIREACCDDGEMLSGTVEIDETYIGGKEENKHAHKRRKGSQGGSGKIAVLGMRERGGKVKAKILLSMNKKTMQKIIEFNVIDGSTIYTDDNRGYLGIGVNGAYHHERVNHSAKEYVNGMASTNGIESVWALLKRGYNGTYHQFSRKHLRRYIDEFTFRLNDGNVRRHTWERIASLCDMAFCHKITYKELTV